LDCRERRRRTSETTPGEARRDKKQRTPKQNWQAELKEDAENKSSRRKDGAYSLDKGISQFERKAFKICLKWSAVVFL
jgi:hypothetical protein